ncbi:IclR family transcriptional regulator [Halobacillus sp. Marseille-Q1614]|uniref:IclR family transcriptional regulator n=1 Tax=Halobacillus sp. Marseille-Q1614 TaxID=2709134 RepID=UPI00156EDD6D|nr:IclR family transcriptional regulator [Halobacillus sp. Marseille-Q1614]
MAKKQSTTVQSVDRALNILEILKEQPKGLGVTELSYRLEVSKSTVHRLLSSLLKQGFVKQDDENERYLLGLRLIEFGETVSTHLDIRKVAAPYLNKLAENTGETVHLVQMDHGEIVYIDKTESDATIRMFSKIGKRAPMHCTGVGKAILAFLSEGEIHRILDEKPLKKFTKNTITDKQEMKKHLEEIRQRGVSFDLEEHEEGIRCSASPIFNSKGEVVGGISVAGPLMRVNDEKLEELADKVLRVSKEISRELGS